MTMREQFRPQRRPRDDEFNEMWQKGLFAFDTSSLLNIYRFNRDAAHGFLQVMRDSLAGRIWLPH